MIISIGGKPGSGKSTIAKMLADKLGYTYYYIGGMRRKMAEERKITLHQLNSLGETEEWTDKEVDAYQRTLGQREDDFVIDGRTSHHFIPHALKIFVDVTPRIGAERVFRDIQKKRAHRTDEDKGLTTIQAVEQSHRVRIASDKLRYHKYYDIDVYDTKQYDFVLDTSTLNVQESFEKLYDFVSKQGKKERNKS